jgi:hypothetical protein
VPNISCKTSGAGSRIVCHRRAVCKPGTPILSQNSKLIARIISESGFRRSEFVQSIGYKNTAKGLRRLDELLDQGSGDEVCLQRIVNVYQPNPGELAKALDATEAIRDREQLEAVSEIEERERRRFIPFIWVHMEDGAHSFLMAVAERRIKVVEFREGFERRSKSEQLANRFSAGYGSITERLAVGTMPLAQSYAIVLRTPSTRASSWTSTAT